MFSFVEVKTVMFLIWYINCDVFF